MNILNKIREDVYGTPLWIDEVNDTGNSVSTFPCIIVLGFDDFKQCQDFANKYNLEIIKAYRPKRHPFYIKLGVADRPFSIVDYIRNNNNAAICGVVNEEFINYLRENSSLSDDNYKELKRMLKDSPEGYSPIWTEKSFIFTGHFDETYFKNEQMEFENGKAEFVIGVLVTYESGKEDYIET